MNQDEVRKQLTPLIQRLGLTTSEVSINYLGQDPIENVRFAAVHFDGEMVVAEPEKLFVVFEKATSKDDLLSLLRKEMMISSQLGPK